MRKDGVKKIVIGDRQRCLKIHIHIFQIRFNQYSLLRMRIMIKVILCCTRVCVCMYVLFKTVCVRLLTLL